jgi:hypothetical protein
MKPSSDIALCGVRAEVNMNLLEIINSLFSAMPTLLSFSKERRELRDNALRAIIVALDATYLYYRDLSHGRSRDLDREAQLVHYWSAAAIPMRHVDPYLAERCDQKAEYWLNPEHYTREDIKELDIGLESVRNAYRTLLQPRSLVQRSQLPEQKGQRLEPRISDPLPVSRRSPMPRIAVTSNAESKRRPAEKARIGGSKRKN